MKFARAIFHEITHFTTQIHSSFLLSAVNRQNPNLHRSLMYLFTSTTALFVWLGCMVKHRRLNFWFCAISITSTRTHVFKVFQCCLAGRKYFLSVLADKKKHYFPIFWESLEQPNAQLHMLVMLFFLHILIKSHNAQCSNSRVKSKQTQLEHFPSHCKKKWRENFSLNRLESFSRWFSNFSRLLEIQRYGCEWTKMMNFIIFVFRFPLLFYIFYVKTFFS
jgi:hypothetical protein